MGMVVCGGVWWRVVRCSEMGWGSAESGGVQLRIVCMWLYLVWYAVVCSGVFGVRWCVVKCSV